MTFRTVVEGAQNSAAAADFFACEIRESSIEFVQQSSSWTLNAKVDDQVRSELRADRVRR